MPGSTQLRYLRTIKVVEKIRAGLLCHFHSGVVCDERTHLLYKEGYPLSQAVLLTYTLRHA